MVVEREVAEGKTAGGIVLPDSAKDKPSRGTVIAVGDGRLLDDGSRGKLQVKVGDKVLFTSYAPEVIKINDDEVLLMRRRGHSGGDRGLRLPVLAPARAAGCCPDGDCSADKRPAEKNCQAKKNPQRPVRFARRDRVCQPIP